MLLPDLSHPEQSRRCCAQRARLAASLRAEPWTGRVLAGTVCTAPARRVCRRSVWLRRLRRTVKIVAVASTRDAVRTETARETDLRDLIIPSFDCAARTSPAGG